MIQQISGMSNKRQIHAYDIGFNLKLSWLLKLIIIVLLLVIIFRLTQFYPNSDSNILFSFKIIDENETNTDERLLNLLELAVSYEFN